MKKIILFPVIVIVAIYFVIAFVVPQYQEMQLLRTDVKQKEVALKDLEVTFDEVSESVRKIKQNGEENTFISDMMPSDAKEDELVNAASRFSTKNTTDLFTIGFGQNNSSNNNQLDKTPKVAIVEGTVIATGTYDQIFGFMRDLFRMKRSHGFQELSIAKIDASDPGEEASPGQQMEMTAVFGYHYLPTENEEIATTSLRAVSYDIVKEIRNGVESVEAISGDPEQRPNPFLP